MYTVMDDDAGYYLRATAMYTDMEGSGRWSPPMTAAAVDEDVTMPAGTLEMYDAVENGGNGNGSIDRKSTKLLRNITCAIRLTRRPTRR